MSVSSSEIAKAFCERLAHIGIDFFGYDFIRKLAIAGQFALTSDGKIPDDAAADAESYAKLAHSLVNALGHSLGSSFTEVQVRSVIESFKKRYGTEIPPDEIVRILIDLVPAGYLEQERVKFLSKEELERQVLEKTKELTELNKTLEGKVEERTKELQQREVELLRANEELKVLDKVKSQFVSVAAHQLRTPLSAVKWTFELLLSGDMGTLQPEQKTLLMKAHESNQRLIGLINDLLDVDHIESGKFTYRFVPIDLFELIDNLILELASKANARKVRLILERSPITVSKITADPEKLRIVLQNLMENGIKYTLEGGAVHIGVAEDETFLTVTVRDTGIGIPEEDQGKLFTKFFRAPNAVKVQTEGSGLGLFIVKEIVLQHGGKIWFESKAGKGTTFSFTIPKIPLQTQTQDTSTS